MWLTFLIVIVVDWSGASVTPRGLSVQDETLERVARVKKRLIGRPWKAHWRSGSQPQVMVKSLINLFVPYNVSKADLITKIGFSSDV